jgi:hypothetical protein
LLTADYSGSCNSFHYEHLISVDASAIRVIFFHSHEVIEICEMSLLIRKCIFDNYWQYSKFVKLTNIYELRKSPLINLITLKSLCNTHANPNILNDRIRKCLDYLTNEYKKESWQNNKNFDFIDFNTSCLLNERMQFIENLQSLRDLGK